MTARLCILAAITLPMALPAQAQSFSDKRASLTPQLFGKKIVALIQAGAGYVTKDQVEKALEFQFARGKTGEGFAQYVINHGPESYFSATLQQFSAAPNSPDGAISVAIVEWKNYTFGNAVAGVCVDLRTFESELKHLGWYLGYASARPAHFDEFYKDPDRVERQSVTVYPDENCVLGVQIKGTQKTPAQ